MIYSICKRVPPLLEWYWEYWYQKPLDRFFTEIDAYVTNRWIDKTHLVRLPQVKKGSWMETEDMMFHAVFQLLVEFVEGQLAHLEKILSQDAETEGTDPVSHQYHTTNVFKRLWNRQYWKEQLGMAHLRSQINDLESDFQRLDIARRTLELYQWYKWERANRPDSFQKEFMGEKTDSKWTYTEIYFDHNGEEVRREVPSMSAEYREYCLEQNDLAERNYHEDTRRAQQVLAIRDSLWT